MIRSPPLPSGPWGAQHAPGSGQSPPFSGAITLLSRAAARPSFPNTKPGRGFLRLGKKGKRAMAEQVNLRIARQGWDAWNAHDVEGWLKSSTKSTCGRPIRCRRLSTAAMPLGRRCGCTSPPSRICTSRSTSCSRAETTW